MAQKNRTPAKPGPRAGRSGGDDDEELTDAQIAVFGVLPPERPMSAYEILDEVRRRDPDCGVRAPQQVYRALDKLISLDYVHRVESLNAFVCCSWEEEKVHPMAALTVCIECGKHTEVPDRKGGMKTQLERLARQGGLTLEDAVVELHGFCSNCR